jgi:glycerophosphoryl diester phosphodiesterase
MAAFAPIALVAPNYDELNGYWLKAYSPGTTTPKVIATDSTGDTQLAKAQLDINGFINTVSSQIFIPYINGTYDLWLFPTAAEADANDTINALQLAANAVGDSQAIVSDKRKLTVVVDQTVYALPADVLAVAAVFVSGRMMHETDNAYTVNIGALTLTLSEGLSGDEVLEIWASSIAAPSGSAQGASGSFADAITAAAADLTDAEEFVTLDGVSLGDNFGAVWANTSFVNAGKAGTVEISTASVYDVNGKQFKQVGDVIRLESLGIAYSTAAATVLTNIISLRGNGFNVDVSDRYTLTTFNGQKFTLNNQKEVIIHRGMQDVAPQNTMIAWSMAYNRCHGQNIAFELDIQISSDGIPVCFHDLSVDSLTNGTGVVTNLSLAQLKVLKFTRTIGTAFEDNVTIPTLDEFMAYAVYVGVKVYPEIKAYRTDVDIEIINDVIRKYRYENMTTFTSFKISDFEKLREFNSQSSWAWATPLTPYTQSDLDRMAALGGHGSVWQSFNQWVANPTDIDVFHSYGWDTASYTPDRAELVYDMSQLGLHKFNTDKNLFPVSDMTSISSPRRFNLGQWSEIKTGSGSVVYTANPENAQSVGEIVTCDAGIGDDARVRLPFNVTAGEMYQIQVFACNTVSHADNAQIDIDLPFGQRFDTLNIIGTDYIEYVISCQGDFKETFAAYEGAFVLGSTSTEDSGAKFYRPLIKSSNSLYGSNRVIMQGYLVIASGGVAGTHVLKTDSQQVNIDTILASGNDIDIRPQNETQLLSAAGTFAPFCNITASSDGQATLPLYFEADTLFTTGNLRLSARNMTTGTVVNLNTITSEHRIYIKVEM